MKKFISMLLAGLGVFAALAFAAADARSYNRGHYHGGYHGGARVGVYVGVSPWLYPRPYWGYGYPYAYGPYGYYGGAYYPTVVEQPVVYTEQPQAVAPTAPPAAAAAQVPQQYWFFCQDTQTYYPHAQNCPTPWQRVVPHAPR